MGKLDIYDDSLQEGETHGYGKLWWNDTSIMPSLSPTTEPSPSHTPPSSLTPTDTPDLPNTLTNRSAKPASFKFNTNSQAHTNTEPSKWTEYVYRL